MKLIYLKPALKCDSFDVAIGIKIPFFRVLVTIERGRSLLQFVTTNCLIHAFISTIQAGTSMGSKITKEGKARFSFADLTKNLNSSFAIRMSSLLKNSASIDLDTKFNTAFQTILFLSIFAANQAAVISLKISSGRAKLGI